MIGMATFKHRQKTSLDINSTKDLSISIANFVLNEELKMHSLLLNYRKPGNLKIIVFSERKTL